jgi:glutamate dehydrogenase/leucine dehydrogenase
MIAANGDELRWTYEGTGSLPDEDGDSTLTGTFVISGGTGRFSDATGSGTFQGTGNAVTGAASLSYRGTISY